MRPRLPVGLALLLASTSAVADPVYPLAPGIPAKDVGPLGPGKTLLTKSVAGHTAGPGALLEQADLRWANLDGCDLTGARLDGADCRGASFRGANLTGAVLEGARLFGSDFRNAMGANLSGALLHPFFEPAGGAEPLGALQFYHTGGRAAPSCLVSSPLGDLFWLEQGVMAHLTPTGVRYRLRTDAGEQTLTGLGQDTSDRLWLFGERYHATVSLADLGRVGTQARGNFKVVTEEPGLVPLDISAGPTGDMLLGTRNGIRHFRQSESKFQVDKLGATNNLAADWVGTVNASGTGVFLACTDRSEVLFVRRDGKGAFAVNLAEGCRAQRIIRGPGTTVWFTQGGPVEGIGCFDEATRAGTFTALPPDDGPRLPRALAFDAEGNLWFAQAGRASLGRLKPGGTPQEFPLPFGWRAESLVRGTGGRMLFTVAGEPFLGSILAVPPPQDAAPEPKEAPDNGWSTPVYAPPRAERRKPLTDEARRERHQARILAAELRFLAREAAASPAQEETKVPAAPLPKDPLDRLAALDVNLSPGALRSILAKHGHGARPDKSQFAPEYRTPAALATLIAEGLEASGAIGRVRVTDQEGHYLTFCRKADVGVCSGSQAPTDRFVVRTLRHFTGEGFEHDVIGAYPVR